MVKQSPKAGRVLASDSKVSIKVAKLRPAKPTTVTTTAAKK